MNIARKSPSVPAVSIAWSVIIAVILFLAAHFALLVGVTTPDKFYFDEVHYVPAARQMLEPAPSAPGWQPGAGSGWEPGGASRPEEENPAETGEQFDWRPARPSDGYSPRRDQES